MISIDRGRLVNKSVRSKKIVGDYLLWLREEYKDVCGWTEMPTLNNADKEELEGRSIEDKDRFWEWMEENYKGEKMFMGLFNGKVDDFMSDELSLPDE
jgi:hypothetical protein